LDDLYLLVVAGKYPGPTGGAAAARRVQKIIDFIIL